MQLNFFSLAGFLAAVTSLLFGIAVLLKARPRKLGVLFFLLSLSVASWGGFATWIGAIRDANTALLAWRLAYAAGVTWAPVFFFHFVTVFCRINQKRLLFLHYVLGAASLLLAFTGLFFPSVRWTFNSMYHPRLGPFFIPYLVLWLGSIVWSHYCIVREYRATADGHRKNQIKYFFLATAIAYGGVSLGYLPKFGIDVYPWGDFTIALYPLIMSYAILRYRLMDIRIFVRRAVLLIGVYCVLVFVCIAGVALLHAGRSAANTSLPNLVLEIMLFGGILSIGPFLYAHAVRESSYFREQAMSGLTHELKGPLAAIESALDFLHEQRKSAPPGAQEAGYFDMIERNSARLRQFVDDLLQVFRGENKDVLLNIEEVNLTRLCQDAAGSYRSLAEGKGISIGLEGEGLGPDVVVRADKKKIEQVLSNLLSNAVKFTEKGGIKLSLAREGDP
ncbi:MAG: hypothetical protein LHV69_04285 [Elusimicrobia bacterium]|nr:hypothetical protein [Candidatus Obscuribacterium magneticum]